MISTDIIYALVAKWTGGEKLLRSVLILVCGMLLFNLPTVIYKMRLLMSSVVYFFMCWDKSWKKPADPGSIFGPHISQGLPVERKTIYFVRHGESTWNDSFNKGNHRSMAFFVIGFIPGLIKSVIYELYLLLSGKMDSWFVDSPLSHLGLSQVNALARFLKDSSLDGPEGVHIQILRADPDAPRSKLLSSNLRRAVSTLAGGLRDRLARRPMDKILVVPSLQEISSNPDTLSLTPPHTPIQASWIETQYPSAAIFQDVFTSQTDMSLHTGNKPLSTNGLKRTLEFCEFVFSGSISEEYIIVGGHSIWFKCFFNLYLPYSVPHVSKTKKIVNSGIVVFDLLKADTKRGPKYMIDPKTIQIVYGGF